MYVEKSKDFTPTPAGVHKAVCSRFVDLGTQEDNGPYGYQRRRQVMISWEIPDHRVEIDGKDLPCIHNQYFTWSMHEKSNLRQALETWRGKTFTEEELAGPPDGFNTRNLIGVGCMLHIMHNDKGKAKLKSIMPLPRNDWSTVEGKSVYFQMQDPADLDMEAFDNLSEYHQGKIKTSPEWAQMTGSTPPQNESFGDNGGFIEDEVPF